MSKFWNSDWEVFGLDLGRRKKLKTNRGILKKMRGGSVDFPSFQPPHPPLPINTNKQKKYWKRFEIRFCHKDMKVMGGREGERRVIGKVQ